MISDPDVVGLLYLVAIVCFIVALRFLSSPKHARKGNWVGGVGMVVAIATTLALDGISNWGLIVAGGAIGSRRRGRRRTHGEDDRDAADGGPVQRGRRRRGGARRARGVPRRGGRSRLGESIVSTVLSALIGSISFSGSLVAFAKLQELISRAADRVRRPEHRQRGDPPRRAAAPRRRARGRGRRPVGAHRADRARARLRRDVRAADRRRRHAGRDLAAERVHRSRGIGHGLRSRLDRADRRGNARRRIRHAAHAAHGEGDEPLRRQRALRRVRPGADDAREAPASTTAAPSARRPPRTSPCSSPSRAR